jgi:hypothetical protein
MLLRLMLPIWASADPIRSGSAYLPVTAGIIVAAGISSRLFARIGTRPVIVAGALIAAAGVWYLSRIPVHGTYPRTLLPGLLIMAFGVGAVLVSVTTAANAGVPEDKAGLAAGLLNASQQLGTALGLAIFSAIASARTAALLGAHASPQQALTAGFQRALLACGAPPSSPAEATSSLGRVCGVRGLVHPADPEGADDRAALIAQRHLRGGHPYIGLAFEGLPLDLPDDRPAGPHDLLLVLPRRVRMGEAEDVEVGLAGQVLHGGTGGIRGDPARADEQEPAQPVLEEHPLSRRGQQVVHTEQLELVAFGQA